MKHKKSVSFGVGRPLWFGLFFSSSKKVLPMYVLVCMSVGSFVATYARVGKMMRLINSVSSVS